MDLRVNQGMYEDKGVLSKSDQLKKEENSILGTL